MRTIMYHGLPKLSGAPDVAKHWADNLAGDLSGQIPNVYVLGLGGISFPLSRAANVTKWSAPLEGYTPHLLMADRFVYYNRKLAELP
jgi:hypothetical protein